MHTIIVSRYDVVNGRSVKLSEKEYKRRYHEAIQQFGTMKVKIDDGNGGVAWMFFESCEDMRVWRNQK